MPKMDLNNANRDKVLSFYPLAKLSFWKRTIPKGHWDRIISRDSQGVEKTYPQQKSAKQVLQEIRKTKDKDSRIYVVNLGPIKASFQISPTSRKNEKTPGVIYEDIFPAEGNSIPVDIDIHVDTHCPNEPPKKTDLQKHQTSIDEIKQRILFDLAVKYEGPIKKASLFNKQYSEKSINEALKELEENEFIKEEDSDYIYRGAKFPKDEFNKYKNPFPKQFDWQG